jgi:hypothetical protein
VSNQEDTTAQWLSRPFTLTTAAGLGLLFALRPMRVRRTSLATGSAATSATTASVKEAATSRASMVLEPQTPPPRRPRAGTGAAGPSVTGGVNVDLFSHYVWRGFVLTDRFAFQPSVCVARTA